MAPPLPGELVEEVLLRLPPADPASLVRAALVCRGCRRLLSVPAFRRRYLAFHGSPPMLGFLYRRALGAHFMPTPSFRPPFAAGRGRPASWRAVDARHGRVLYYDGESVPLDPVRAGLVVSHPVTGDERRLTTPRHLLRYCRSWSGALLCAAPGCAHIDCPPGGPFAVVFVGTDDSEEHTRACCYSSESGKWSKAASVDHPTDRVAEGRSALVGNSVYFIWEESNGILEYDLGKQELCVISLPPVCEDWFVALMAAEDGGLGFAIVKDCKLHIWSREPAGPSGWGWAQRRVVELRSVASDCAVSTLPSVIPFANGDRMIFAFTHHVGVFAIDIKSGKVTKVCKVGAVHGIVPYICFYFPALEAASTALMDQEQMLQVLDKDIL